MKFLSFLDRRFEEIALAFFLILICVTMLAQVIARYVLNDSMVWPEEFCRYCYVWTTFLSLGLTIRHGTMLRVGVLADMLPAKLRLALSSIIFVIMIALFGILFKQSLKTVSNIMNITMEVSSAMRVPMWIMYLSAPIGFALGALRSLEMLILGLMGKNRMISATEAIKEEAESVLQEAAETEAAAPAQGR